MCTGTFRVTNLMKAVPPHLIAPALNLLDGAICVRTVRRRHHPHQKTSPRFPPAAVVRFWPPTQSVIVLPVSDVKNEFPFQWRACPEPLAHFLQERHLHTLNGLFAAHASVHGAFGRIKIRRFFKKLRGLRAESSERCHTHRDEVQLFLPYQVGVFDEFLPLFGSRRFFSLGTLSPKLGFNGCVTVISTATGSAVVQRSKNISAGRSRPSICTSFVARTPAAAPKVVRHLTTT